MGDKKIKRRPDERFTARLRGKTSHCRSLYEAIGSARAMVMDGTTGECSSIFDHDRNVVVAVWTDDANGPKMHKLDTFPQEVADAEWERIKQDLLKPY